MTPCENISALNLAYQELNAIKHFSEQQLKGTFTKEDLQFYLDHLQAINDQVKKMKLASTNQFSSKHYP